MKVNKNVSAEDAAKIIENARKEKENQFIAELEVLKQKYNCDIIPQTIIQGDRVIPGLVIVSTK